MNDIEKTLMSYRRKLTIAKKEIKKVYGRRYKDEIERDLKSKIAGYKFMVKINEDLLCWYNEPIIETLEVNIGTIVKKHKIYKIECISIREDNMLIIIKKADFCNVGLKYYLTYHKDSEIYFIRLWEKHSWVKDWKPKIKLP